MGSTEHEFQIAPAKRVMEWLGGQTGLGNAELTEVTQIPLLQDWGWGLEQGNTPSCDLRMGSRMFCLSNLCNHRVLCWWESCGIRAGKPAVRQCERALQWESLVCRNQQERAHIPLCVSLPTSALSGITLGPCNWPQCKCLCPRSWPV